MTFALRIHVITQSKHMRKLKLQHVESPDLTSANTSDLTFQVIPSGSPRMLTTTTLSR